MKEYFLRTYRGKTQSLGKAVYELYPDLPYSLLARLLKQRDVFLDGVRSRSDVLVAAGHTLNLYCQPAMIKIPVVYRDEDLAVVYKPKGVASDGEHSFESLARYVFGDNLTLLHRLDTNTDGLLMFALNPHAYEVLYRANSEHRIVKYYRAVVNGAVWQESVLEGYLLKDADKGRVKIYHEPKEGAEYVECKVTPISCDNRCATVNIKLKGGKTHQLRAQLADWGHFILGDGKYGDDRVNRAFHMDKQQLTAVSLVFPTLPELPALSGRTINLPDEYLTI